MCGAAKDAGVKGVDLDNVEYVLINNLGVVTGKSLGLSQSASLAIGSAFSHFAGIADVLSGNAAAFLMVYSLIKSFIEGCDPRLLPKKLVELNKHGMPERSMWLQAIILFISFGSNAASQFCTILMDMMNVSSSAPYLFLIAAYPFFKAKKDLDRPFVFIEGKKKYGQRQLLSGWLWLLVSSLLVSNRSLLVIIKLHSGQLLVRQHSVWLRGFTIHIANIRKKF